MQVSTPEAAGSELHAWRNFLARKTLWLGVLLTGSGLICAVAANWPALDKLQRFTLVQGLLALATLTSIWTAWRLRASADGRRHVAGAVLALAGLVLGALLALLGQTYQTGADNWELFAWWAALLLPWALAAASQPLWLLWTLVLNLAAALWLGERWSPDWLIFAAPGLPGLALAGLNLLLLAGWEFSVRRWRVDTRVGPRVLAGLALAVLVAMLLFGGTTQEASGARTGLAWVAVTLGLGYFYQRVRRDLVILAMLAAGVICVSLRVVGEWLLDLQPGEPSYWAALPLAGLLMAEAVWAAHWLRRVAARAPGGAAADGAAAATAVASAGNEVEAATLADSPAAAASQTPWYAHALLGLSAWLATALLLLFLGLSGIVLSEQGALISGLVMCLAAVATIRGQPPPFWRQCATALGFAGQLLVVFALFDAESTIGAHLFILVLGLAIYIWCGDALLRFLSGLMVAFAGAVLVWHALAPWEAGGLDFFDLLAGHDDPYGMLVWLPVTVAAAWAAALAFFLAHRMVRGRRLPTEPLGWALALSSQGMAWQAAGVPLTQWPGLFSLHPPSALGNALGALLPVAAALVLAAPRRAALTPALTAGVPLGLLVLALFWLPSPGIALALTWMLLGFGLALPRLRILGILSLLGYLGAYYYQLDLPLLQKALWLGASSLLLLAMRMLLWWVPRALRTAAPEPAVAVAPPPRWRTVLVLAGLVAALGVANGGIWQREKLLASGRTVILQLAPVDPRSLMQGDYMALRFAAGDGIPPYAPADGYLVLVSDAQGVASTVRLQDAPAPLGANEVALRYRIRQSQVRIVTNAYFFPEGQGAHYAQARYGEIRVDGHGTGLLVRMLDENLQPL